MPAVLEHYFAIYDEYQQKYPNQKIVVAMEVGSFFEFRGSDNDKSAETLRELSLILNCKTYYADSKKVPETPLRSNPLCLGFPVKEGDKVYFPKLVFHDYWVVVVRQNVSLNGKVTRSVHAVLNKTTYVPIDDDVQQSQDDPTVLVLYQEKIPFNDNIVLGMAVLSMTTGRIVLYHGSSNLDNKTGVYEDLERWVYSYRPIQIMFNNNTEISNDYIPEYGMRGRMEKLSYPVKKEFQNISYQEQILEEYFGESEHVNKIDELGLMYCPETRFALMYLLQYLIDAQCPVQNALLTPILERQQSQLFLEKNAIKQLHIDELTEHVINCLGIPGKRLLRQRLTNPSIDPNVMTDRWDFIEATLKFIENNTEHSEIKSLIRNSIKIERIVTRMAMSRSLFINDIRNLFLFIKKVQSLQKTFSYIKLWVPYLQASSSLDPLMEFMTKEILDEEVVLQGKPWIFNEKFLSSLSLLSEKEENEENDYSFAEKQKTYRYLSEAADIMLENLNRHLGGVSPIVYLKDSKTEGYVFIGSRAKVTSGLLTLKKAIHPELPWNNKIVSLKSMDGKNALIHSDIAKPLMEAEKEFMKIAKNIYRKEVMHERIFKQFKETLRGVVNNLAELDVALSCAIYHQKQTHVRPSLVHDDDTGESQLEAIALRHAVIEHRLINGSYIPNDFQLSKEKAKKIGIVLYGINSSGKSSAMRAIGLGVVMAQAGLFVPASEFRLMPFSNIMTRINGGDDLMRGTSSYTVEILECLQIAKRGDKNTLVLGDEIGQSTDPDSGTSLVSSLMDYMVSKNIKFVIATHMQSLPNLCDNTEFIAFQHLHVGKRKFNEGSSDDHKTFSLEFDRKLRDGIGPSTYGLDVAEHLGMPAEIIIPAKKKLKRIRNEPESLIRVSRYDSRKVYSPRCSTVGCNNYMVDEDHIIAQVNADDRDFIETELGTQIHKHNPSNLQGLCKECHKKKTKVDVRSYRNKQQKMDQFFTFSKK